MIEIGTRLLRLRGGGRLENFILGDPEISGWGGYYHANNTFFAINVPVFGALQVTYRITTGAVFALFLETPAATKMEIGLQTVTDALDSVCVTYADGVTAFASLPTEFVKVTQHKATHYQRKNESGGTENWWPVDAAFGFGAPDAQLQTVCVVRNGVLGMTEISGPFPKAASVTTTTTAAATTTTTAATTTTASVTTTTATPPIQYTVTIAINGNGTVTSSSGGISCTSSGGTQTGTCSASYSSGASVTLTATPTTGSFVNWTGGLCAGTTNPCAMTVTGNTTETVVLCNGTLTSDGSCWYLSGDHQSCDTVCGAHGACRSAGFAFAGNSGTSTNCNLLLNTLGAAADDFDGVVQENDYTSNPDTSVLVGCTLLYDGTNHNRFVGFNASCAADASFPGWSAAQIYRACPCLY